jgi:hypothetical protein
MGEVLPWGVPKGGSPFTEGQTGQPDPSGTGRKGLDSPRGSPLPSEQSAAPKRESYSLRDCQGRPGLLKGSLRTPPEARTAPPRQSADSRRQGVPLQGPDGPRPTKAGLSKGKDSAARLGKGFTWQEGLAPTWPSILRAT